MGILNPVLGKAPARLPFGEANGGGPGPHPLDAAGQCGSDGVLRERESAPVAVVVMVAMMEVPAVMTMMARPMGVGI